MHLQKDMYNITKISGGFLFNEMTYNLNEIDGAKYRVLSDSQLWVYTDQGIILFDLTCTIDGVSYTDINLFGQNLTN
jgi:hypothetical protein